ncbi:hypothetical protein DKP76_06890 [Falsochrobactrum shanghaiense]|uniref:Uncharacterized protein n=1 Tax=Falsochrobactrum shanghaiense TaxID=2201899 RepID=A0A316JDR0_9HYPH|nr:hypothetical protein [Falsochrobactrum shanghaiense]PWL18785.1 hypothetical protein DKP76_06890 [Falsochrobactrum shanghaiense]
MHHMHGCHVLAALPEFAANTHMEGADAGMSAMEKTMFARFNNRFGHAFAQFNSAVQAAAALRVGHQPRKRDLQTLGIDVAEFRKIHE